MSGVTLDGFLTVEKFLWCSPKIEYYDRMFDLADLPRNIRGTKQNRFQHTEYYEYDGQRVTMHKFIGDYNTDIKLSSMSNVARVELIYFAKPEPFKHACAPPVTIVTYDVAENFDVPDFVGLRAVGEGLFIRFVPIDPDVTICGTMKYRQLRPLQFMEPIASDTMFCLMANSQVIACHQGEIYSHPGCFSLKDIAQFAKNTSYQSDKKMFSWPMCEMTIDTDFLDMFRLPWITFLSNSATSAILQIKSQDIGRFEQLAVQTCSQWNRHSIQAEDPELTQRVNAEIEAENKKAVAIYNAEKTEHPQLVPGELGNKNELEAANERYQRIIRRAEQQIPGYQTEQTLSDLPQSKSSCSLYMFQ